MVRRDGLLRSGNEVLLVLGLTIHHLVQLLIELLKLSGLAHLVLDHELRCLQGGVVALRKELQAIVDEGLVEEYAPLSKEVAAVANHLDTTIRVIAVETEENFVMGENLLLLYRDALGRPCSFNHVVVLIVANRDRFVHVVADGLNLLLQNGVLLSSRFNKGLLLLLERNLLLEKIVGILLGLESKIESVQ